MVRADYSPNTNNPEQPFTLSGALLFFNVIIVQNTPQGASRNPNRGWPAALDTD